MVRIADCVFCCVFPQSAVMITMLREIFSCGRPQRLSAAFLYAEVITMLRKFNCFFRMQKYAKRMCDYNVKIHALRAYLPNLNKNIQINFNICKWK